MKMMCWCGKDCLWYSMLNASCSCCGALLALLACWLNRACCSQRDLCSGVSLLALLASCWLNRFLWCCCRRRDLSSGVSLAAVLAWCLNRSCCCWWDLCCRVSLLAVLAWCLNWTCCCRINLRCGVSLLALLSCWLIRFCSSPHCWALSRCGVACCSTRSDDFCSSITK